MASLLARAGETVHVIGHRFPGAPKPREEFEAGHLIVHRIALDQPASDGGTNSPSRYDAQVPEALLASCFPAQAFSWQAALLAERLIEREGIDVIEAQEWEAPLYYLQMRRAQGLGPLKRPPCVVHIHSPAEKIFAANDWDTMVADYLPAVSMEAYSIGAADAILCASRYVAEEARLRYEINVSRLNVIPYPLGDTPWIPRSVNIWSGDSICHVGRLEPRKGVIELAAAATLLAEECPNLEIEFVGDDTPLHVTGGATVGETIRARTPRKVRRRFRFRGGADRRGVVDSLSRAWASVVPSRWDNLPYSCIEAMCSGLPVIVSPNGGMSELVVDGVSGWVAPDATPLGLASALRRAQATPATERERLGRAAAETVHRLCGNDEIVRRHLALRRDLVEREISGPITTRRTARPRMGVIVTRSNGAQRLEKCLSSLRAQTAPVSMVCVVGEDSSSLAEAIDKMAASDPSIEAVVFVDSRLRLEPEFLSLCATLFERDERLAIVSGWTHEARPADRVRIQPCPTLPYIWTDQEVAPYVAVRSGPFAAALQECDAAHWETLPRNLFDRIVSFGGSAVTYPAVLGSIALDPDDPATGTKPVRLSSMAQAVQRLHTPLLRWLRTCPAEARRAFLWQGLKHPMRSALRLVRRA